jgi:CDGSH-type Zn-finger protein/uncharacterized Fe-S cluster protein YjdI
MAHREPRVIIETREELVYILAEAAAIEHNLMCCYLYAAWSLKRGTADGISETEADAVRRWRASILSVAIEEMTHLALASNLITAVGGAPHFSRPNFPIPAGYHPEGVVVELRRFDHASLDHFIFLERPEGDSAVDSEEFPHPAHYVRKFARGSLMPSAQDYLTVGHLYRAIKHGLGVLSHHLGEKTLFSGDPASQLGGDVISLKGVRVVTDLKSAEEAIETIIEQGEGAPSHREDSHYSRFLAVRAEFDRLRAANPAFEPAFPCAHNPVMRKPLDPHGRVYIDAPEAAHVLDLTNAVYIHLLRCLVQAYGRGTEGEAGKRLFCDIAIDLMFVLDSLGAHLATLAASESQPGVNAGMTFTTLRDLERLPLGTSERVLMAERLLDMAKHADRLFPSGHALHPTSAKLVEIAAKIELPAGPGPKDHFPRKKVERKHAGEVPPQTGAGTVEVAEGRDITVLFSGKRCIHARFCVLGAPSVFKANTPGTWIFPDTMPVAEVVEIAHRCPSGAIAYHRKDGGPEEHAPPVNVLNTRENGPYAIHAPIKLRGADIGFRATLCRCGASQNKPFCDNSHIALGFKASGEPDTVESTPLQVRDGSLDVSPEPNGPLVVTGNLEICSGTGRTVNRVVKARLCRCGGSRNKPFCDNTHLKIGFQAP